jgi:hypothetical protein
MTIQAKCPTAQLAHSSMDAIPLRALAKQLQNHLHPATPFCWNKTGKRFLLRQTYMQEQ